MWNPIPRIHFWGRREWYCWFCFQVWNQWTGLALRSTKLVWCGFTLAETSKGTSKCNLSEPQLPPLNMELIITPLWWWSNGMMDIKHLVHGVCSVIFVWFTLHLTLWVEDKLEDDLLERANPILAEVRKSTKKGKPTVSHDNMLFMLYPNSTADLLCDL